MKLKKTQTHKKMLLSLQPPLVVIDDALHNTPTTLQTTQAPEVTAKRVEELEKAVVCMKKQLSDYKSFEAQMRKLVMEESMRTRNLG